MTTFSSSLEFTESFDVSCQLRLHLSTCHFSTFERGAMGRRTERERETSRCVLNLAVQTIYCSQPQARKQIQTAIDRVVVIIIGECYFSTRSPTFIWPRFGQNSGIDLELIKTLVRLSHLKGISLICQSPSL